MYRHMEKNTDTDICLLLEYLSRGIRVFVLVICHDKYINNDR
jgi:hypothetical protein